MRWVHVAPSFASPKRFNHLAAKPERKITMRVGRIEDLFADPPGSPAGRAARLQVLGLFYYPLQHAKAGDRYAACWDWVKERVFGVASDGDGDAKIQEWLEKRVASLPVEGESAKIRLPGGYVFRSLGEEEEDPAYPSGFGSELFDFEERFYQDNPVLGKIPVIVRVENADTGEPVAGQAVRFRLLPPDDVPGRPALFAGVEDAISAAEVHKFDPADPLESNCHADFGGRRGRGGVFSTEEVAGFHPRFAVATPGDAKSHEVEVVTNEEGEAGVIFQPSRQSGDRYRLRAYLGPADPEGLSTERIDTGTLVVWRNLRISRWLRKPVKTPLWPELVEEAEKDQGVGSEADYLTFTGSDRPFVEADLAKWREEFARAWCELEVDGDLAAAEEIDPVESKQAYESALADIKTGMAKLGRTYALEHLFYPSTVAGMPNVTSLFPMRLPDPYNEKLPLDPRKLRFYESGELAESEVQAVTNLVWFSGMDGYMRALSKNGALPGLTVLHSAGMTTWEMFGILGGLGGIATQSRGYHLFGNPTAAFLTNTTIHEMGHCLFREHAPGADPAKPGDSLVPADPGHNAPGSAEDEHDSLADFPGNCCVMSYASRSIVGFCAKCLLALRGWNIGGAAMAAAGLAGLGQKKQPALVRVPENGDRFVHVPSKRGLDWAVPELARLLEVAPPKVVDAVLKEAEARAKQRFPGHRYVRNDGLKLLSHDVSSPKYGASKGGHKSHCCGKDIDFAYLYFREIGDRVFVVSDYPASRDLCRGEICGKPYTRISTGSELISYSGGPDKYFWVLAESDAPDPLVQSVTRQVEQEASASGLRPEEANRHWGRRILHWDAELNAILVREMRKAADDEAVREAAEGQGTVFWFTCDAVLEPWLKKAVGTSWGAPGDLIQDFETHDNHMHVRFRRKGHPPCPVCQLP